MFPLKDIWAAAIQNPDDEHTQHECDEATSDSFVLFHQLAKDGKQCSNTAQHVQSSQHQKSACVSRCSVKLSRWRKIENRSIYFLTCPSKSAFSSCHRPLRMAPKLFAVAEIRSRISSVSSGRLCVFFATQLKHGFSLFIIYSKKGEK